MKDSLAVRIALMRNLRSLERSNRQLKVPKKKVSRLQHMQEPKLSVMRRVSNFSARVPQIAKDLKLSNANTLRAAYAIGVMKGILVTSVEWHENKDAIGRL